ncbi:class I SAM-dependent methyltransferase [Methylomonas rapida]|jgi:Methylase involved in ubiquinone/menaquinone biosynthesis|uniref:Class I SAM-dependent methyltransferase n=1 Tax=Methylomonas rapida TaxID=2963939 RepID=A0ABY7GG21_9GAMM|nr:class I SAM-dependent methyltransferase [Methylomonas rapida]WAR44217.1 class I SAM-dependent methyltransferase [Methylomonas rapida]
MKRNFLFALYQTPRGKLLQTMEAQYLKRCITVSCKQNQLQIGGLDWEADFVDCSLYRNYVILDGKNMGCQDALKVNAKAYNLPIQTESMDLVIIPHMLEFDAHRFRTMREVHRVLKPGGELVILSFNPLSLYVRFQFLWDKQKGDSWLAHFMSRARVSDWLKLLNFELLTTAEFGLDTFTITQGQFASPRRGLFSMAYGLKAVKRQYSLIPLTPVTQTKTKLATANFGVEVRTHQIDNLHD